MNKVILIGHLGGDPEIRYTTSGKPVANLSLATSETFTKDGQKVTDTQWHKVVAFDKKAELCGEYLKKGAKVAIEGRIKYRTNEKDGVKYYHTDIVMDSVEFLERKKTEAQGSPAPEEDDIKF